MRLLLIPIAVMLMAADWVVDYQKSSLKFDAVQEGTPFTGTLVFKADIAFDPKTLKDTNIVVNVPLKQTDAGTKDRNETLLTKEFFNVEEFPAATYESTKVTRSGNGYVAHGTLVINGIRQPLDIPFTLEYVGDETLVKGEAALSRKTFAVGTGEWEDEATIADKVTIRLDLTARKI